MKASRFYACWVENDFWIWKDGHIIILPDDRIQKRNQNTVQEDSIIKAPMPGRIIKVFAQLGSPVTPGETLISLEAMKMEYSLKASAHAVVKKVNVKEGDQVPLGTELVELELKSMESHSAPDNHTTIKKRR